MIRTILQTSRISGSNHHLPNGPQNQTLLVDLEFKDGKFITNVPCIPCSEITESHAYYRRQRRLAFDISDDGSIMARLPAGNELRRVLKGPDREADLTTLNAALRQLPR